MKICKAKKKKRSCKLNHILKSTVYIGLALTHAAYLYTERAKYKELKRLADYKQGEHSLLASLLTQKEEGEIGDLVADLYLDLENMKGGEI